MGGDRFDEEGRRGVHLRKRYSSHQSNKLMRG